MNGKDYYMYSKRPTQSRQMNDYTAPNRINEGSFIESLERKIYYQNQTINNLIKAVQESKYEQQRQYSYMERLKQLEEQKYNQQILEELKTLKHKIKKIEQVPLVQSSLLPQMFHQPYLPPLQQSPFQPAYPIPQNNYYMQNPFNQQGLNQNQQIQNSQQIVKKRKPREMDTLHKFLIKMLSEKDQKTKKPQESRNSRFVSDVESSQLQSSKRDASHSPLIQTRQSKMKQKQKQSIKSIPSEGSQSFIQKQSNQQSHQVTGFKQKLQKIIITPARLKELGRKFRAIGRYYWLALTWLKFCQKIWIQKALKFKDWSQEIIGKYDAEFNYLTVIGSFHRECVLKKFFEKSWIFTQTVDIQIRCQNLLNILEIFFRYLIVQPLDLTQPHIEFTRKIALPNGYLLSGHSKYVVSRMNLRPNSTLDIQKPEQSQMILMEYAYIQILLPQIVEADFWKKLVNYKEALKIFISTLHYLFVDKFYSLPASTQQLPFNNEFVPLFDFKRNPVEGYFQLINSSDPQYVESKDEAALGLYQKAQLHPLILHVGFKKIQENFKQYCELIYSLVA